MLWIHKGRKSAIRLEVHESYRANFYDLFAIVINPGRLCVKCYVVHAEFLPQGLKTCKNVLARAHSVNEWKKTSGFG